METQFSYIRNRIAEYKKNDLLRNCYQQLDINKNKDFPIWCIFTLIKWTLIYGEKKYPQKALTPDKFNKLYKLTLHFNDEHITSFIKNKQVEKAFHVLYNQQFYLQKNVYKETYATQIKLFSSIKGKHDIEKSFLNKTGFTIFDFIYIEQLVWLYINIDELKQPGLKFYGFLDNNFLNLISQITSKEKILCFINLLTLNPKNAEESISNFKHKINKVDLQTMEMTFFTMFPFTIWENRIKLVHTSVFKHTINYYIYDFLKNHDDKFTSDFGFRLEKYVELGLKEIKAPYKTETQIEKLLPSTSKLTDFWLTDENIFIECKAIEMQAHPSINPTDELIFLTLKKSLFKAYFEQLYPVSKSLKPNNENWGIIITYKEFFWSQFSYLFEIGKDKFEQNQNYDCMPPNNVFIIDIYTWDKIIKIIKGNKLTMLDILKKVKSNNSNPSTSKQLFDMHLTEFSFDSIELSYLKDEIDSLDLKNG